MNYVVIFNKKEWPFGKLGIGISASATASALAFKYEPCLLYNINHL